METDTHRLPGMILTDHTFEIPLDHSRLDGPTISVFAREVAETGRDAESLPWLVYLQGGPGFPAPRPTTLGGWLKRALAEYRVLLLDQRGMGRSTPVTPQTLAWLPDAEAQAEYLMHFRADATVRDAEWIRRELIGDDPWTVLGQSYGGFCLLHYLSAAPGGLREGIFTGGLPPIDRPIDDVYRATYRRVLGKNRLYYDRYPGDEIRAQEIVAALEFQDVRLRNGDRLTPRRFQQLGIAFGSRSGFEDVHYLLEGAFVDGPRDREISHGFLRGFETSFAFDSHPIYAMLHEPIYCQGEAARWSAERIREEYPAFQISPGEPVTFTGEMVYPWIFEEYSDLRPLKEAAEILATHAAWPRFYDRAALARNEVPCVAAIYYDDMYVERAYSEETAAAISGLRCWVTNEYEHDAIRVAGERVLGRLLDLLHGKV
jgi:pimeloyl-ACP methyl ester carboxylesterase